MGLFSRRRRRSTRLDQLSLMDHEVREEIRFHLEMRVKELEAKGLSPDAAMKQALEDFGDPEEIVEETKNAASAGPYGGWRSAGASVVQDLMFAFRTLWKSPMFTAVAVISLGLGIGANTAIFSVTNSLIVRPLNVEGPHELALVYTSRTGGQIHGNTSLPDFLDYRDRSEVFSGLAAYTMAPMAIRGDGAPRVGLGQLTSWDYFAVLGVEPVLGRGFLPEEDEELGANPVAVLSHKTWQTLFDSDPEVLGRVVRINDSPFVVVGVAPAGFVGLMPIMEPDLWAPLAMLDEA